jgi:hypothetical protein
MDAVEGLPHRRHVRLQLFTRRIDATRGAEVGTGVSGVYDALQGVKTERGADAPRLAFRRMDGVAVRVVDARRRS